MPRSVHPRTQSVMKYRWKNKSNPSIRIVEVLWLDAISIAGTEWASGDEAAKQMPAPSVSVGYLWADTPEHVTVVALVNENHIGHGITIPRGMIVEIRDLV
jgi:hypothetical protein